MNRKQRRAARRSGAEPAFGSAAKTAPAGTLAELFSAAAAHHQAGALAEAERRYRHILASFPTHAETHSMLGAALMVQNKTGEAIPHFERALALKPEALGAYEALGRAYMAAGKLEAAMDVAARALELNDTPQGRIFFAQCLKSARFTEVNDRIGQLALRALSEGWAAPRELTRACMNLIKLNGVVSAGVAQANSAWPARLSATELFGASGMAELSRHQLLVCALECDPIIDLGLERVLTSVRYAMLKTAAAAVEKAESLLGFYCSIARQCFINDYVYSTTDVEADQAQRLQASLEAALAAGTPCSALWPVVVGAYFPLHALSNAQALLERPWPQCVNALLVQQIEEPAEERRISTTIPVMTRIDGEVSRAVREQYEESPYPRWAKAGPLGQPAIINERQPRQGFDVLIAGCGTGLSAVEFARQARGARVVAIDLSLASLSYAKRMAQKFGVANVEFGQADIMKLASIGRDFDVIESSGVLHHLENPWDGWRVLLALLRPGGAMQVGLYSDLARQNIVAVRALIAERGYRPIPQDIRRCREDIAAAADPLSKSVIQWEDFFTTNECRDLLFNVQEHRITLPEIKSFLTANGVEFAGFIVDANTLHRFATRFPERAALLDLDCWHAFETAAPRTFAAMYQFWIRKAAVASDQPTRKPN
jgi:2-polyprenyl-3-methyl-5-hydroxy-6-metoxy-1,4-benzoquinol methylase/tetratricopeptide (TPR) repeat protein